MNPTSIDLHAEARRRLIAAGLDPNERRERSRFNLAEHRLIHALEALDRRVPESFAGREVQDARVAGWADRFVAEGKSYGILMLGPTGSHKTTEAYAAIRRIAIAKAERGLGFAWQAATFAGFNALMRPRDENAHLADFDRFCNAEVVLLDDLGVGLESDWTDDTLYRLIDHRWANKLATIVTTNLPGKALAASVDQRVASRLGSLVQMTFRNADGRKAETL